MEITKSRVAGAIILLIAGTVLFIFGILVLFSSVIPQDIILTPVSDGQLGLAFLVTVIGGVIFGVGIDILIKPPNSSEECKDEEEDE